MATAVPSAVQVGSYFVGQYYQVLQQKPDLVHQFYTDSSTMIRIDGDESELASSMLQIHSLIMSLNLTEIEIKTVHSLGSCSGGVLVMASGSVQTKHFSGRRMFVQSFFLAPQEKGFFVLNDIFHFFDVEQIHQHPAAILAQNNFDSKLNASSPLAEPASNYMFGAEIEATEFVVSAPAEEESDPVDRYSLPEEQQQQVSEAENIVEETPMEEPTATLQNATNAVRDSPVPIEEPSGEPPKQTYASILRIAKGQSASSVAPQPSFNKGASNTSVWQSSTSTPLQSFPASTIAPERYGAEAADEVTALEEEGELTSVYVRNLPITASASDVEHELKQFGRIKPEGVVIRHRKDTDVCYAFVEFEDVIGVQNAIEASPIRFGGRTVRIEERRANSSSASRGGRRARGRSSYQTEALRGRFGGRSFGRGSGQDGGERDYSNRVRGNGFHQRGSRQDRVLSGHQVSRDGQKPSERTS